jgi:hypothetical protein
MKKCRDIFFYLNLNQLVFIVFLFLISHICYAQTQTVFAVVGDMGSNDTHEGDVATMINSWYPSFVFTVGDNVYTDSYPDDVGLYYHQYMYPHESTYGGSDTTTFNHFWPIVGNHDWDYSINSYHNYFNLPNYYTKQIGDIEFFIVDSDTREPDGTSSTSNQAVWIHQQITNSTAKWKIILFHHPAYSSGYDDSNSYMQWPFENWGVDVVLNGHAHDYERILRDDNSDGDTLVYFIDGLGGDSHDGFSKPYVTGSMVRYAGNYGALKVIEKSDSLRFEFHSVSSGYPLIDSYTINKSVLPVELITFTATVVQSSAVQLKWSTATEVNNYGFDVERSSSNSGWQKIGFVVGSGNSNSPKVYSYTDNPSGGNSFSYRLKQIDIDGKFKYYNILIVNLTTNTEPELMQNSPNPFNPSTAIKFYIPLATDVTIKIYDILGREVRTLVNKQTTAGYHIIYWNGRDSEGETVVSGIYLYRLTAGSFFETKKMSLLK